MSDVSLAVFGRWHEKLAALLAEPDRNRVPGLLFAAVRELLDCDSGQVCVMGESIRPVDIYDDVPPHMQAANIQWYCDGAYLLDPYYHAGLAMHRKNAYQKLDIRSPSELFHLFIDSLDCYDPGKRQDPLLKYLATDKPS